MIRENKIKIALSLLITLLPMIVGLCFWNKLSEGYEIAMRSMKILGVLVIPISMFVMNVCAILYTNYETKKAYQNKKVVAMVLFIIPILSVFVSTVFYSILLGRDISIQFLTAIAMGTMFIITGNYMPKSKQNRTIGIKIRWTLANEDNWNYTHRLAGKIYFFTGFAVLFVGFLPIKLFFILFIAIILTVVLVPVICSYLYYKNNVKSGKQSQDDYCFVKSVTDKKIAIVVSILVALILIGCVFLLFTGTVETILQDDSLEIKATYSSNETIPYTDIDTIEYRTDSDVGMRVMGFASPKLLLGTFRNDEFGTYTRFSYNKCDDDIIITVGNRKIAINAENEEQTRALYEALLEKIN